MSLSVESEIKAQFEKIFDRSDGDRFKRLGELLLSEATKVRTADLDIDPSYRLLARNSRKRLFIGIGIELILKAFLLKAGYCINKPKRQNKTAKFPFFQGTLPSDQLEPGNTYMLGEIVQHVSKVIPNLSEHERGLAIAKVFRNKEGHSVCESHHFDASNYRDIEAALVCLYKSAFNESLDVSIAMQEGDTARWAIRSGAQPMAKP